MNIVKVALIVVAVLVFQPRVSSASDLGSGYSCEGQKIFRRGREVKLSVAQAAVDLQLSRLGTSKKNKVKRDALKALRKALRACIQLAAPGATPTPVSSDGGTVASVLSSRVLGDRPLFGLVSNFGTPPAGVSLQIQQFGTNFIFSVGIGENIPVSERFFPDIGVGPFLQIAGDASLPFTGSVPQGSSTQSIKVEANKVTLRWFNIPAGSTRNGAAITEIVVVVTLLEDRKYSGTVQYLNGTNVLVSGTFSL